MEKQPATTVSVRLVLSNPKAYRALKMLTDTLADIAEDFGYREDVKRACRAARCLAKHVEIAADEDAADVLLSAGCEFIENPEDEE